MAEKSYDQIRADLHQEMGKLNYLLEKFGDYLAKQNGYKDIDGIEAVQFFLMEKHHWTPATVKTMSLEDTRWAMTQEMAGWSVNKRAA